MSEDNIRKKDFAYLKEMGIWAFYEFYELLFEWFDM